MDDVVTAIQKQLRCDRAAAEAFLAKRPELNSELLYSEVRMHGFLIELYPGVTAEELIAAHNRSVQIVLEDPNVGLRRLTEANWREHSLYASRYFDQIKFDLGKLDNAPAPFTFPSGELTQGDQSRNEFVARR